jgi:hypothetical protein
MILCVCTFKTPPPCFSLKNFNWISSSSWIIFSDVFNFL